MTVVTVTVSGIGCTLARLRRIISLLFYVTQTEDRNPHVVAFSEFRSQPLPSHTCSSVCILESCVRHEARLTLVDVRLCGSKSVGDDQLAQVFDNLKSFYFC